MPDGTQNCTSNKTADSRAILDNQSEIENEILNACHGVERKLPDHPCPRRTSFSPTPLFSALLQHGLLFAPRLLLAAQMNERQRQASVTMRTRVVASECHLRDRFLVSHRGAAQVLDASPFRLTSEPSPHGHANHLAHDSAMVSALLDRSLASHTPCITRTKKKCGFRGRAVALSGWEPL